MSDRTPAVETTARREDPPLRNGHTPAQRHCGAPDPENHDRTGAPGPEWLTKDEWNACFFVGLQAYHRDRVECTVCAQVVVGMERLRSAGYRFENLRPGRGGALEPEPGSAAPANHEHTCREIGDGTFDHGGQASRALSWLRARVPGLDRSWLEDVLERYGRIHAVGTQANG